MSYVDIKYEEVSISLSFNYVNLSINAREHTVEWMCQYKLMLISKSHDAHREDKWLLN